MEGGYLVSRKGIEPRTDSPETALIDEPEWMRVTCSSSKAID
jgi:hypothetical protein